MTSREIVFLCELASCVPVLLLLIRVVLSASSLV